MVLLISSGDNRRIRGLHVIQAEFDHPHCPNCPIGVRQRNYFTVLVNAQNQILADNAVVSIDSLPTAIHTFLNKVGTVYNAPDSFGSFHYTYQWDTQCHESFMDSVLTTVATAHMSFVKGRMEDEGMDFCGIDHIKLDSLKSAHPLSGVECRTYRPKP